MILATVLATMTAGSASPGASANAKAGADAATGTAGVTGTGAEAFGTLGARAGMAAGAGTETGARAGPIEGDHLEVVPEPLSSAMARGVAIPSPGTADTAWGTDGGKKVLERVRAMGATHVSLCPIYQMGKWAPFGITPAPGAATTDQLRQEIAWARELGMPVVLRPQIEGLRTPGYFHIRIRERHEWIRFFEQLDTVVTGLAQVAQETHCEALSIGTRLYGASTVLPENWHALIGRVRSVYSGKVTYDADDWHEAWQIPFWADLDIVSVTVYHRLGGAYPEPPPELLMLWRARRATHGIAQLWYRYRKPVWISELGFPSNAEGARLPYQRPAQRGIAAPELQADQLRASLLTCQDKRWLSGLFLWAEQGAGGAGDPSYTLQDKPAEAVVKQWMGPGRARDAAYYGRRPLLSWLEDWF